MDNIAFEIFHQLQWSVIFLAMIAILVGAIIQGATGLGFGMVSAPALLLIHPIFVPGPMLLFAMVVSLLVVLRDWREIDFKGLGLSISGRIPGTVLAALAFSLIPFALYGLIFGIMILIAVTLTSTKPKIMPSTGVLISAGFFSGFMGTLTSVGAPPMALAYQHGQPEVIRSTLASFFLIGGAISIFALYQFDKFSMDHVYITAIFILPLFIGFRISSIIVPKLNQKIVRRFMLSVSGISAVILIIKSMATLYF